MTKSSRDHWPLPLAGTSPAAERARAAFVAAAASSAPALIVADRGLDPESIARAIHERSRPGTPFTVFDCAAADAPDVERGLFGTRPRVDAGPRLDVVGPSAALLRARAGTLHLRNILDLPA